jgi:hypothetical protein
VERCVFARRSYPLQSASQIRRAGLDLLILLFLPKTEAWFYPQDSRKYVCGEFNRSFDGPHVQVRVPPHL